MIMKKTILLLTLLSVSFLCSAQDLRRKPKTSKSVPSRELRRKPEQAPAKKPEDVTYKEAFLDIYTTMGRVYPAFEIKGIDWEAVGDELLPRAETVETDEEFGLLCMELVARLQDSHALVLDGLAERPKPPLPQWDPGFACLIDSFGKPVVYHVDSGGPARGAGVESGMTVVSINGLLAEKALQNAMTRTAKYWGYSSNRYLRYSAARSFIRQMNRREKVELIMTDPKGKTHDFKVPATLESRYLPRLPVPIDDIRDSGNVSWTMLKNKVGYIYVRRIKGELIDSLDEAVDDLSRAKGLIIDVRGNSGGGFDSRRAFINFDPNSTEEPKRPRFDGPIALLTDARCISAGEGWASWFIANKRATVFGEATAGASSKKRTYTLKNDLYKVIIPVKLYRGSLDRPIEGLGLEPDVPVRQNAIDLADEKDTVLETARRWLTEQF